MAGNRHNEDRVCLCERPDGTCAALAVRRLSHDRVRELAEEIWTASSGDLLPARPVLDPRSSRPGASAMTAYRRRRHHEREAWRRGWRRRAWVILGAAATGGLVIGSAFGEKLAWLMTVLAAALAWWRLRFRPSAGATIWWRQAVTQRRTAGMLEPLSAEGWLVLHDVVLPGWLDSLDHVVVGQTGVWVVESWRRSRLLPIGMAGPAPATSSTGCGGSPGKPRRSRKPLPVAATSRSAHCSAPTAGGVAPGPWPGRASASRPRGSSEPSSVAGPRWSPPTSSRPGHNCSRSSAPPPERRTSSRWYEAGAPGRW